MVNEQKAEAVLENLALELRRGVLVLAVLSQLRQPQYGYSLKKLLGDQGLDIDEGTLYPLLRRLEAQGLLESAWQVEEERPRKYYRLNPQGEAVLEQLAGQWRTTVGVLGRML